MQIYDISMPISHEMAVYKNKPSKRPKLSVDVDFETGTVYESRLEFNLHTGTHLDMPLHIIPGGSTIDQLQLDRVVTTCRVLDLQSIDEKISAQDLAGKNIKSGEFILLKTKNSSQDILQGDYVFLSYSGAELLKAHGVVGVGIDSLGIERGQPGHETHKTLMGAGILILEGLRLQDVPEGEYQLIALPLSIPGAEAAPVRAILIK